MQALRGESGSAVPPPPSAYPRDLYRSLRQRPGLRADNVPVAVEKGVQVCRSMRIEFPVQLRERRLAARCETAIHHHFVADQPRYRSKANDFGGRGRGMHRTVASIGTNQSSEVPEILKDAPTSSRSQCAWRLASLHGNGGGRCAWSSSTQCLGDRMVRLRCRSTQAEQMTSYDRNQKKGRFTVPSPHPGLECC